MSSLDRVTCLCSQGMSCTTVLMFGSFQNYRRGINHIFVKVCLRFFCCWMCRHTIFKPEQKLCGACRRVYKVLNKMNELEIRSLV